MLPILFSDICVTLKEFPHPAPSLSRLTLHLTSPEEKFAKRNTTSLLQLLRLSWKTQEELNSWKQFKRMLKRL